MNRAIFDAHCDTLLNRSAEKEFFPGGDSLHIDLPSLLSSNVQDQVMAVCIKPAVGREKEAWQLGLSNFEKFRSAQGIKLHFALEGCDAIAEGWELPFHPIVASLTWNGDNAYAGGIGSDMDLTDMGQKLAKRLINDNTAIDVSHLNDRSRKSLLKLGFPVCATHCNARKLCTGFNRNLPDDDIIEIAKRGGVIGVTFVPDFLEEKASFASIESVINHLEYIAEKTSISSVGFGSDFDGVKDLPDGISGAGSWPQIIYALENRGWSNEDINKVAGNNWRRFFKIQGDLS